MSKEEMENLDSETQEDGGDDVQETSSETEQRSDESNSEYEERLEQERKKFEDQRTRAEKAEAKLKELREQLNESKEIKSEPKSEGQKETSDHLTKEEAILFSRGLSEEEVEKVKSIAKIEGESPLVAAESDYFKLWKEKKEKEKETKDTQLGTSKGSIKTQPKKTFTDKLSPQEHKELWKKSMGR